MQPTVYVPEEELKVLYGATVRLEKARVESLREDAMPDVEKGEMLDVEMGEFEMPMTLMATDGFCSIRFFCAKGFAVEWKNKGIIHAFTQNIDENNGTGELMPCLFVHQPWYRSGDYFHKTIPELAKLASKRTVCIIFGLGSPEASADCFLFEGNKVSKLKLFLT